MNQPLTPSRTYIAKLVIRDTGTYNQFYRRPYATTLDPGTLNTVLERVNAADRYNPMLLSGVAGQFLRPSATPERPLAIPGGWEQPRARFMLQLVHEFPGMNYKVIEQVTGYTDYNGITSTQAIDPQMKFYANNVVHLREVDYRTPYGAQTNLTVAENSHVLADNNFDNILTSQKEQRMRPEDMYATIQRLGAHLSGDTADARTTVTNVALKSRRVNGVPSAYVANMLEHHRVANASQEFGSAMQDVYTAARGAAAEPSVTKDPFLMAMSQVRSGAASTMFTYQDLVNMDPNVHNVKQVSFSTPAERQQMHFAGQSADWSSSDIETQVATMLANSVVALMMEIGITVMGFQASNMTLTAGETLWHPLTVQGFSSTNMQHLAELFRDRFFAEIFPDITYGGQFPINIEMLAQVVGDTRIKVQVGSGPMTPYVVPTYCDSLFVPVLTSNLQQAENVARDFNDLITAVESNTSSFQMTNAQGQSLFGRT